MAAVPKRRLSTHRKGKRRAAIKIKPVPVYPCPNCGQSKQSHQVCPSCGYYKGKLVVDFKARRERRAAKKKDEKSNRPTPPKKKRGK